MNEYDWYGLDNVAKIFPAISGNITSSVYRVDVRLKEVIIPAFLEEAVNKVMPSFPAFMVRMRKGLFWYYFEHNFEKALVDEEKTYPCSRIDAAANSGYIFKFSYFNNKISLDVFHALSDGTGAINFLIAVTSCYLQLCGKPVVDFENLPENPINFPAMQDSFAHFFSPRQAVKPKNIKAYHIKATPRASGNVKVIHGIMETGELIKLAKIKNVTITSYLAAVLAFSILETIPDRRSARPIRLSIPINLRRFFETETQRNFFTFITVDVETNKYRHTFDEILRLVSEQMTARTKPEYFLPRVSYYMQAEKNIFTRVTPLVIKNLALRLIYRNVGDETLTCNLSNLGKINVSPSIGEHIERFDVMSGTSRKNHFSCVVCSFKDKLVVTFTKSDFETDVEKHFFRFLAGQNIKIILEQN